MATFFSKKFYNTPVAFSMRVLNQKFVGESPSWPKAPDFDSGIRRFESFFPCQLSGASIVVLAPVCFF